MEQRGGAHPRNPPRFVQTRSICPVRDYRFVRNAKFGLRSHVSGAAKHAGLIVENQRSLQIGTAAENSGKVQTLASAKAKKIQELREARGYSVEDVAHRMGETPERVRALEASDEDPDEGVLSQYLDTLGMSQDEKRKVWDEEKHA